MTSLPASRKLSRRARWAVGIGAAVFAVLAGGALSKLLGQMLLALMLFAAALPLCRRMESRISRPWAAGCAVSLLVLGFLGLIGLFTPMVIAQISQIMTEAPRLLSTLQTLWDKVADKEWARMLGLGSEGPGHWIERLGQWLRESLPDICGGLLNAGMDPETPAAVLEKGTTAAQRRISSCRGCLLNAPPRYGRGAGISALAYVRPVLI